MEFEQTKIGIETTYPDSGHVEIEYPWADKVGENRFQIKNFPFYAYAISYDDIVEAEFVNKDDKYPFFTKVITKSGHRTLRIKLDESAKESKRSQGILDKLSSMECGYEGTNGEFYFVINVQPQCDFDAVRDFLNDNDIRWEYADPTYEKMHSTDT